MCLCDWSGIISIPSQWTELKICILESEGKKNSWSNLPFPIQIENPLFILLILCLDFFLYVDLWGKPAFFITGTYFQTCVLENNVNVKKCFRVKEVCSTYSADYKVYYYFFQVYIYFYLWHLACRILVPQPGIEPSPWQWKLSILATGLQWIPNYMVLIIWNQ